MGKFFKSFLYFIIPVLVVFFFLEFLFRFKENTFSKKSEFLNTHESSIECIILGSSHQQTALNPEHLELLTANLAYGSQDYFLDSVMLNMAIKSLPNLKQVILEFDYHSLEYQNEDYYWRNAWYRYYYDVDLPFQNQLLKHSFLLNNPIFYLKQFQLMLKPEQDSFNKYGFTNSEAAGLFSKMQYNEALIEKTATNRLRNRHTNESIPIFEKNTSRLKNMVALCQRSGINVLLVSSPLYYTYRQNYIPEKNRRRKVFIESMKYNFQDLVYEDYSSLLDSSIFFNNDDHLNSLGASIYSDTINSKLKSLIKNR